MMFPLVFTLFVVAANACSRRPPPPPPPPPNSPPPPPVPPPIVKVVRQQEQMVGFNKCYQQCDGRVVPINAKGEIIEETQLGGSCPEPPAGTSSNVGVPAPLLEDGTVDTTRPKFVDANGNRCVANTNCKYVCKFRVYTEVALTVISKPSNCGCAFHITMVNPRPARVVTSNIVSAKIANEISIGKFELVVWDHVANRVVETVPAFNLQADEDTRKAIEAQLKAGQTSDFTSVTAGFAGQVTQFPMLPASLNLNDIKNENNVPALTFEITQTYTDIKAWEPPVQPNLDDTPNAYQSQCVPFWKATPFCYNAKKRQANPGMANAACNGVTPMTWMKKYLLFPKLSKIAANQGKTYAARLITSFYNGNTCRVAQGLFSIDAEFTGKLKATEQGANLALGTWAWDRVFQDGQNGDQFGTSYVIGVPGKFSSINEVWDKGYSTIDWNAPTGYDASVAGSNAAVVLAQGICSEFAPTIAPAKNPKYGEQALVYKPQAGIKCAPFDDAIRSTSCGTAATPDKSLMAFLNEGEILNFNKKPDSMLIMGKMDSACNTQPYKDVVFDVLTFHGVQPGREPLPPNEKRSVAEIMEHGLAEFGLVYDDEAEGLVHFLHPRGHAVISQPHKRALADALRNQVATPPNEENLDMRVASGSTDKFGTDSSSAGDHPIELFPELWTAPVNIDPQADAPAIVVADVTTGSNIPLCNRGSIGCSCRISGLACDIGLQCDAAISKCLMKGCEPGKPGCPCKNDACEANNECKAGVCKVKSSCTIGTAGCECLSTKGALSCTDASVCKDGLCLLEGSCTAGAAGCSCADSNEPCTAGFSCNTVTNVCLAPRCADGTPGCRCHSDYTCQQGFQCDRMSGVCSQLECKKGDPGCSCDKTCQTPGFKCVAFTKTGDYRCVAEPDSSCGDQTERCVSKCGKNNVRICPRCQNGVITCLKAATACDLDPFSPGCSPAGQTVLAGVALLVALVAALF